MDKVTRAALLAIALFLALLPGAGQASTLDRLPGAPGYVHEVYTSGSGLLWISNIAVEAVPRFYETVWFRLLCADRGR